MSYHEWTRWKNSSVRGSQLLTAVVISLCEAYDLMLVVAAGSSLFSSVKDSFDIWFTRSSHSCLNTVPLYPQVSDAYMDVRFVFSSFFCLLFFKVMLSV